MSRREHSEANDEPSPGPEPDARDGPPPPPGSKIAWPTVAILAVVLGAVAALAQLLGDGDEQDAGQVSEVEVVEDDPEATASNLADYLRARAQQG